MVKRVQGVNAMSVVGMRNAQAVILTDTAGEAAADDVLAALDTLAFGPESGKPKKKKRSLVPNTSTLKAKESKFKSRFFFKPAVTPTQYVAAAKARAEAKKEKSKLNHVNQEIVDCTNEYKVALPKSLAPGIRKVRDFFLNELAPVIFSGQGGVTQAHQVAASVVGEVDNRAFVSYEKMLRIGVDLKLAQFAVEQLKLPKESVHALLSEFYPKPSNGIGPFPLPTQNPSQPQPQPARLPRHARNAAAKHLEPRRVKEAKPKPVKVYVEEDLDWDN